MGDFDEIFSEIGNFGKYQAFLIFACIWSMIPIATNLSAVIFLGFPEAHQCASINQMHYNENNTQVNSNKTNNEIFYFRPQDSCSMYIVSPSFSNRSIALPNNNETMLIAPCIDGYNYERTIFEQTIRTEWDLVCDHSHLNTLATSLFCLGMLLGSVFGGSLADRYGRKRMMVIGTLLNVAFGIACSFSPNFFIFVTLRFFIGAFAVLVQIAMATYTVEIVGKRCRSWVGLLVGVYSGLGYMTLSGIAFFCRRWRKLQLILGIIFLPFLLVSPVVPESPRLLIAHGKFEEARKICTKIASWNGRHLKEETWNKIIGHSDNKKESASFIFREMIKSSPLLTLLMLNIILWFVNGLVFFALSFNVGHWSGDPFLNNALSGLVELIACILIVPVINKLGRRNTIMLALTIAGVAISLNEIIGKISASNANWIVEVVLLLTAKFTVSGSFNLLFLYTAELFPTEARNTALGISTVGGRAASIVAPFLIELQHTATWILTVILAVISFGSVLMTRKFPETKGERMFSTIDEAEVHYKKHKRKTLLNNNQEGFSLPTSEQSDHLMKESSLV